MKPRVFVSSTYYDLKYIRENLDRFLNTYGFEPVLFENGSVTYEHDVQLDESCYNEVKLCHMMILIIGGRYGSPANGQDKKEAINKYENIYMSITKKEFKTAKEKGIPIFIFIDKNVYAEFQTYKENKILINTLYNSEIAAANEVQTLLPFKFAHVDSPNVFEFINELKPFAIQTFESFEEIADYLTNQWAGMFYLYLNSLQDKKSENEILNSVSELKSISAQMKDMINEVGKSVLGESGEYEKIIESQNIKILEYFAEKFILSINFIDTTEEEKYFPMLANILIDDFLNSNTLNEFYINNMKLSLSFHKQLKDLIVRINNKIDAETAPYDTSFKIESVDFTNFYKEYFNEIRPLINNNNKEMYEGAFLDLLIKKIDKKFGFPF
jgi:hypothetical protein